MELHCPSCGLPFKADDVDFKLKAARCRHCDRAFALDALVDNKDATPVAPEDIHKSAEPEKPAKVHEDSGYDGLTLSYRWFQPGGVGLLIFSVFWDGFLVVWYALCFMSQAPLVMFIFPILHVLVGLAIGYASLTMLVNFTKIRVNGDRLTVWSGPIPTGGSKDVSTSGIKQLFVHRKTPATSSEGRTAHVGSFDLHMQNADGSTTWLIKSIPDYAIAAYLERRIENYLGIKDAKMGGEAGL